MHDRIVNGRFEIVEHSAVELLHLQRGFPLGLEPNLVGNKRWEPTHEAGSAAFEHYTKNFPNVDDPRR